MYIIIVGAGKTALCLGAMALEAGHQVAAIEKDPDRAQAILDKLDVRVFHGDIALGGILDEADVDRADAIVATTEDDSANLMAMYLGKQRGIKTLVSTLTNQEHRHLFEELGVRVLVNPNQVIAQTLFDFVSDAEN